MKKKQNEPTLCPQRCNDNSLINFRFRFFCADYCNIIFLVLVFTNYYYKFFFYSILSILLKTIGLMILRASMK